jgi:hypothetical protein
MGKSSAPAIGSTSDDQRQPGSNTILPPWRDSSPSIGKMAGTTDWGEIAGQGRGSTTDRHA